MIANRKRGRESGFSRAVEVGTGFAAEWRELTVDRQGTRLRREWLHRHVSRRLSASGGFESLPAGWQAAPATKFF
jgi:hypothetical protein